MLKKLYKYRRIIIQLLIIIVSMILFFGVFLSVLDEEIKNQLLSIITGVLTGSILSFLYLTTEKKIVDEENTSDLHNISEEILCQIKKAVYDKIEMVLHKVS